ncbi:MAG TPA: protein translocase subunit SecD [Solirubrobacteraceae bacterium]|nr:protein translocase subunit SecD [Solirubrobacteraceae bacterium]
MTDRRRNVFILALVAGLIAASVVVISTQKTFLGLDLKGGVQLIYKGEPTPQTPHVTQAALQRAVDLMNQRVNTLGVSEPEISTLGGDISVGLPDVSSTHRAEQLVGTTARLEFYDWESNALIPGPSGGTATVASQLTTQNGTATTVSQGSGASSPGSPSAGSLPLYTAVQLAAKQPLQVSGDNARQGPEYFAFGSSGSAACTLAGRAYHFTPVVGQHCYLAGPQDNITDLDSALPTGVSASDPGVQVLTVKQGTTVLQAVPANFTRPASWSNPTSQFYVLKDHVALFGNDITNPQQSTDQAGAPDVAFGFTGTGATAFQNVTAQIARRGDLVSGLGQTLNQHFAVALDTQLITVPSIDFKTYPDGIQGNNGAEITGGFTINSAQDLATQLRLGALPINLKLISQSQVSATLGKQALHKGVLAGLVGLLAVAIFLLAYYRVLGLIAVAGLLVYAVYFFALIKLIPIVLTLPGIAGLILTIGVAADANVVIFERVKEEIRAGRSIRQGIQIGYRKGLTAIIDANVVTIMTAFILFVLATSEVQGFALTLGIGVFVSLFTAVMATQAILTTMGNSRVIAHPSALGAGGKKRVWHYDFMGASKYFFTLSGTILLIGALAIGGRGLNLGIDFTSGTRLTAGLERAATQPQVSSVVTAAGASGATVQKISNPGLGNNAFQISAKRLQPAGVNRVESALQSHFGIRPNTFDDTSVGPTFGSTVANGAVIAIIASLLVISAYVALRFEWKFAVPVLIALMHDLLITAGVYALTGREVTTATVAALLTILGYSLYDTIIVFDRVRENIPRMPRAAFSQIVNRSMSEVLTRSLATTACTLMPIVALLLLGGVSGSSELQDFAFALLIGVASGAYSSIFIASPVLTHWKEREPQYRARRRRLEEEYGFVPAYATAAADVEPAAKRPRRGARLTEPEPDKVSAAEFEQMKRDLEIERAGPARQTSTLTKRLAHTEETQPRTAPRAAPKPKPAPSEETAPQPRGDGAEHAPDVAENEGVAPVQKPKRAAKSRSRNRRHGRRR